MSKTSASLTSSELEAGDVKPIYSDHLGMCRFDRRNDKGYKGVLKALKKIRAHAAKRDVAAGVRNRDRSRAYSSGSDTTTTRSVDSSEVSVASGGSTAATSRSISPTVGEELDGGKLGDDV